jgi:hypothetical protein
MKNIYNLKKANSLLGKLVLLLLGDMQLPVTPSLSQITVPHGVV